MPCSQVLDKLPEGARVVKVGQTLQDFASLSEQDWASINVLLNCGVGKNAGTRDHIKVGAAPVLAACWLPRWLHAGCTASVHCRTAL